MAKPHKITVELDKKRAISWSNRAQYRLGSLSNPPILRDFQHPQKAVAALMAFLWAMEESKDFSSPEEIAEHVDISKASEYFAAILEAFPKSSEADEKNADGSMRSSSPASS